ncbi:hypothetical protein [Fortiea contorta]|uniref:hypothetical protein n=1 Tax=Fortiea contorta TaxID=1892405 RepID=UPI00034B3739|nr:hypothetical protein [Fortiea contorta]
MSRLKRWLYLNTKKVNADGTLREDYINERLAKDINQASIDDYAVTLKTEYERLKLLDETDPELWVEYTAYDLFSEKDKKQFNPDGSLKPEYVEYALHQLQLRESYLMEIEFNKKKEVADFNKMSEEWKSRGQNFGEYLMNSRRSAAQNRRYNLKQMSQDIRNGEDIDSLPLDIEPDDYYQQQGYNPMHHNF